MEDHARWRYAHASVAGTAHLRIGTACQDACVVRAFDTVDGPALVLAVSDGAGTARFGEVGSSTAVACVLECAKAWFADRRGVSEITASVVHDWVSGIREQIAEIAGSAEQSMRDYAATLMLAILGETHSAFAQLGDGAMVVLTDERDWSWIFWPMHGEYANTTFFVTEDNALADLQFECRERAVHEIAGFTDGLEALVLDYKERTVFQPFFDRMLRPLRASSTEGEDHTLSRQLASYLGSPAISSRSDDDLSLVLATRVPSVGPTHELIDTNAQDSDTANR